MILVQPLGRPWEPLETLWTCFWDTLGTMSKTDPKTGPGIIFQVAKITQNTATVVILYMSPMSAIGSQGAPEAALRGAFFI